MAALCWATRCSCWCGATVVGNREVEGATTPLCSWQLTIYHLLPQDLDHLTWAMKDTVSLECLAWSVYDNILVPGPRPQLTGLEIYGQIIRCLADKAYKGLNVWCSAHTSAMFEGMGWSGGSRLWSIVTILWRSTEPMENS